MVRAVHEVGYESPSPIQAAAIAPLLAGRDLLGQAQTGTGKTAAFALPLLSRLDLALARPQLLVLTPTRELAIQVAEALHTYARYMPRFHVLPVYGGQSFELQLRPLRRGVHAVVGTPGRLLDHLRRGALTLDALRAVVIDEADEMLRMGFIEDVDRILEQAPETKQVALFSATMPPLIETIARRHTRDPVEIRIAASTATVSTVVQRYWQVTGVHKLDALTRILETEDFDAMLVFVRTKVATVELAERIEARGFSCAPLNGDMNQSLRERTVARLKSGRLDILVATDVAARGLDVDRISHVVNYDIPYDTEAYVHRVGRTARAGRKGEAILFVAPRERRMLRAIEKATGQPITPMSLPTQEAIADKRVERFKGAISEVLESHDLELFESVIASYQGEHNVGLGKIAAALACMAQGDRPLLGAGKPKPHRVAVHSAASGGDDQGSGRAPAGERQPRKRERDPGTSPRGRGEAAREPPPGSVRYRIDVGAAHDVEPRNIVGAIANEAGLESRHIGAVVIHEDHSTVELPAGMPADLLRHLKQVWVCGRRLKISEVAAGGAGAGRTTAKGTRSGPKAADRKSARDKPRKKAKTDTRPGAKQRKKGGRKSAPKHAS